MKTTTRRFCLQFPAATGFLAIFLSIVTQQATAEAQPFTIETLAWMAGNWSYETDSTMSEEIWMAPRGGTMVGMNRDSRPGRKPFFEFLRIEQRDADVFYIASPRGAAPTEFKLVAAGADSALFANPAHDFPQRIIYMRIAPDTLSARVEGVVNGESIQSGWRWTRSAGPGNNYDARERGRHRER